MAHPIGVPYFARCNSSFAAQGSALESLFGASKTDKSDVKEWHSHFSSRFLSRTGIRPIDLIANLAIESETLSNSFSRPLVESSKDSYR
jgi:hypothetical protein